MALLFNPESGEEVTLLAPTRLGRSRDSTIVVSDPLASTLHARIFRRDGAWWLRSLATTNGTWLNGELLRVDQVCRLERGAKFRLGRAGACSQFNWVLMDDSPPLPALVADGGQALPLELGGTPLPNAEQALATVWRELGSEGESLALEVGEEIRPLVDGQLFELGSRRYRVHLVEELSQTVSAAAREGVEVNFWVSACQEDIRVELGFAGIRRPLKLSSGQAEVVLRYAERRLADRREGIPDELEGYTDEISELLTINRLLFNTHCSRINRAARETGLAPGGTLIRRDKATGKRRIEVGQIRIV